ncbi:MAG: hypothetical protein NZ744_13920 [Pirellulaceae bacterium]|nr:hypothetical protein [Pirellulaceae bacterium]
MNTALTVWSISAGDRLNSCLFTTDLRNWCYSTSHISLQVYSYDEALSQITFKAERPDLILINTGRRGEFSRRMLQHVVSTYPLSLILEITGEWCIGDTRSGDPLPISCRFDTVVAFQRLQSMLASRQQFIEMRSALNPVTSSSELSSFWNQNNLSAACKTANVIASDRCERQSLQTLLIQEGFDVELYSSRHEIVEGNRNWPSVHCFTDRRELAANLREAICSPTVIIANHFNGLDRMCFEDKWTVSFLRKPFLSHDLVNAISSVCEVSNADAA